MEDLLLKRFSLREYNCWDLVREAWLRLTGQVLDPLVFADFSREEFEDVAGASATSGRYREIPSPESPCIVLMQRPRHIPHVGVYFGGKVLHIRRAGVQYIELERARVGFSEVRFYVPCTQ